MVSFIISRLFKKQYSKASILKNVESKIEDLKIGLKFLFLIILQCQTNFKRCGTCIGCF